VLSPNFGGDRVAHLHDIRYVRIGTEDLDESARFATEILGLQLVAGTGTSAYFRSDSRDHSLCYVKGRAGEHVVGFEMATSEDLDAAVALIERCELNIRRGREEERDQRRVRDLATFTDPTGNRIDLVLQPAASGERYFPSRDAGIESFSHVGLRTTDAPRDEAFWTGQLGAKVSDWIGDAALLRIDDVHHKIALFPSAHAGVQHVNFQVATIDDIMRSYYFLSQRNVRIVFGPGRHPTSGACFLYFQGPDGIVYEYSCGVRRIAREEEAHYVPRRFPKAPSSFCMWGSEPDIPEFKAPAGDA